MSSNPKSRHILELNEREKKIFLDSFDFVLCDCDGVIWMLAEPIPNTGPALMLLMNAGKVVKYISNNSLRTDDEYIDKLTNIGVANVLNDDVVHPVKTITRYIEKNKLRQPVFSICSNEFNEVLAANGINFLTMEPNTNLTPDDLIDKVKPTDKVGAVIIDFNFNLTYGQLARAQQYLLDEDCPMIVGASDVKIPVTHDFTTIGPGRFIDILSSGSGKKPILLGKPGILLGEDLVERYQMTDRKRVLFIGDNLFNDIEFAAKVGFQSLFVLTGASTLEQMLLLSEEMKPDYLADGLADFIQFFQAM